MIRTSEGPIFRTSVIPYLSLFLLVGVFTVLVLGSMRERSLLMDEGVHLAAGYLEWNDSTVNINPEHPPLIKRFAALPLVLSMGRNLPVDIGKQSPWAIATAFFTDMGERMNALVFWSRLSLIPLALGTGILIFLLAKEIWGLGGGLISALLFFLSPNFIAHSPVIHTDVPLAFGFTLFAFLAHRYLHTPTRQGLIGVSFALAFSLSVKFSGILLLPLAGCVWFMAFQGWKEKPYEKYLHLAVLILLPCFWISLTYGRLFDLAPYLAGFRAVYANHIREYAYFMNGRFEPGGFYLYYPFAMILKMPLPTLVILALSIPAWRALDQKHRLLLFLPVFTLLFAGAITRHDIGVRHMLPCFPFLFISAGGVVRISKSFAAHVGLGSLALWLVLESVFAYPDYLAYFNSWVGGNGRGIQYLDDSNIDWGQDVKRLPSHLRALGIGEIKAKVFDGFVPWHEDLVVKPISLLERYFPHGDYAVSAHVLRRDTLSREYAGLGFDWLGRYEPTSILGGSIYIYRIRLGEQSEFKEGVQFLEKRSWLAHGFKRIRENIQENPGCYPCYWLLAQAHREYGVENTKELEAIAALEQSLLVNPDFLEGYMDLGAIYEGRGERRKARQLYEKALERSPDYAPAREGLSR